MKSLEKATPEKEGDLTNREARCEVTAPTDRPPYLRDAPAQSALLFPAS